MDSKMAIEITDPRSAPTSFIDGMLLPHIKNPEDVSLLRTMMVATTIGLSIIIATITVSLYAALLYIPYYLIFMGPVTLAMHNIAHRPMMKKKGVDRIIINLGSATLGYAPDGYSAHHLSMHHKEGNAHSDLSSTMKYQRDSFLHFLHYYFTFLILGPFTLFSYLKKRKRKRIYQRFIIGEASWWIFIGIVAVFNWPAAILVFAVPTITTRFLLMAGNWAQHAFIEPEGWEDQYSSVTTFVNSGYNKRCFNDGYHLIHHLKPAAHWTEMPKRFEEVLPKVLERNSLVFDGIDYFVIWALLMTKRHKFLASKLLYLELDLDEKIALIKHRLKPIPAP